MQSKRKQYFKEKAMTSLFANISIYVFNIILKIFTFQYRYIEIFIENLCFYIFIIGVKSSNLYTILKVYNILSLFILKFE